MLVIPRPKTLQEQNYLIKMNGSNRTAFGDKGHEVPHLQVGDFSEGRHPSWFEHAWCRARWWGLREEEHEGRESESSIADDELHSLVYRKESALRCM